MQFFRKIPKRTDDNYITPWKKYKSIAISKSTPTTSFVLGEVYSLGYNFSKEYDMKELMWYDYMPLVYVHEINREKGYFTGINLHHFPLVFREKWLQGITTGKKVGLVNIIASFIPMFKPDLPDKFMRMSYERQANIMPWVKYAVRHYRFERVLQIRTVTPDATEDLMQLYADTFYGATGTDKVKHFYSDVYHKEKKNKNK